MKIDNLRPSVNSAPKDFDDQRGMAAPADSDRDISLKELFRIIRRQLPFVLLVLALLLLPIIFYASRLEPKYTSVASVVVEPRPQLLLLADGSPAAQPPDPAYLETLASVIRSRKFTSQAMQDLDLFEDPEFAPSTQTFIDKLFKTYAPANDPTNTAEVAANAPVPETDALVSMSLFDDRLQVRPQRSSYVIMISFTSKDPQKAAVIANYMAQLFIDSQLAEKSNAVQRAISGISERLSSAERALENAEQSVTEIRLGSNFLPGQDAPIVSLQAEELARTLATAKAEYALVNAKLKTIDDQRASEDSLDYLAEVSGSPVVQDLRLRILTSQTRYDEALATYGESHPRAIAIRSELEAAEASMSKEIDRTVAGIRSSAMAIATQIEELEAQLIDARERSSMDSAVATRLENAESNAAAKRSLYEALLRRQEEASVQESWLTPDVRLLSEAGTPLSPSSVSPATLVVSGAVVALIFALLFAFLREQMDTTLRSGREVEKALGLACLGSLPKSQGAAGRNPLDLGPLGSPYAQSVGAVWAQLRIAQRSAKVVLITSALPQEGASALAGSLAGYASRLDGMRTALVDFDLWGSGDDNLPESADAPGVVQLLGQADAERVTLEDVAVTDPDTGIDVYHAGRQRAGEIKMAGEDAVGALLTDLRDRYDMVIVYAPPILGSGDTRRLAYFADASLLVVRWGSTSGETAWSALRTLTQASANVVGAVLTQVDVKRQRLYGKGENTQSAKAFSKQQSTHA